MTAPRGELNAQWISEQRRGNLQIRMIPYSPPRISSAEYPPASIRERSRSDAHADSTTPITPTRSGSRPRNASCLTPVRGQDMDGESWLKRGVSGPTQSTSSLTPDPEELSMSSRTSSPGPSSVTSRRRKRVISVNSDTKTFSLLPQSESSSSPAADFFGSPQFSCATPESSWGRVSSNVFRVNDRSSSPATPQTPRTPRMKGGTRRLGQSTDAVEEQPAQTPASLDYSEPLSKSSTPQHETTAAPLSDNDSLRTAPSNSTLSDRTNFKTYGESSPVRPTESDLGPQYERSLAPSSTYSRNYNILGESSSENMSVSDAVRPDTGESTANYVVLGPPSSIASSPARNRGPRSEYSRESLIVAPLRPVKTRSSDRAGLLVSRSRESLRRGSLSSLGATMSQEAARTLFAGPSSMQSFAPPTCQPSSARRDSASSVGTLPRTYQWSAALSTVMSESEGDSLPPSRSLSMWSFPHRGSSTNSRDLLSMASSLAVLDEPKAVAGTPAYSPWSRPARSESPAGRELTASPRMIRDCDEDGDGLADLHSLQHRSSRTRLVGGFAQGNTDKALRPSGSTRSLNSFTLPSWVRLYYGSGNQRFLVPQASSESIRSLYNGSLYNDPSFTGLRNSTNADPLGSGRGTPRRWQHSLLRDESSETPPATPKMTAAHSVSRQPSNAHSTAPSSRVQTIARMVKKQTSSVWSPHLGRDRRISHLNMWNPPPAVTYQSTDDFVWRRHRQQILFVIGFAVPFAWMIAACLHLPPEPLSEMTEHGTPGSAENAGEPPQKSQGAMESLYLNAKWWRTLNRGMAVLGVLLIAAAIALVVLGTKQQLA